MWLIALLAVTGWEVVSQDARMTVERRPARVGDQELMELRVSTTTKATPEQMAETLWAHHEYEQFVPRLKKLQLLSNDGTTKIIYQQVKVPIVKDRDYTIQVVRRWDAATRVYESTFALRNELGPPENPDHVRLKALKGQWTISPAEAGGSDVVYQLLTDPGVALPAWIRDLGARSAAPDLVQAMVARCEKTHNVK
jgi:ribosome-associated toxin RatA of RatAB toxin-antitoxin module